MVVQRIGLHCPKCKSNNISIPEKIGISDVLSAHHGGVSSVTIVRKELDYLKNVLLNK